MYLVIIQIQHHWCFWNIVLNTSQSWRTDTLNFREHASSFLPHFIAKSMLEPWNFNVHRSTPPDFLPIKYKLLDFCFNYLLNINHRFIVATCAIKSTFTTHQILTWNAHLETMVPTFRFHGTRISIDFLNSLVANKTFL